MREAQTKLKLTDIRHAVSVSPRQLRKILCSEQKNEKDPQAWPSRAVSGPKTKKKVITEIGLVFVPNLRSRNTTKTHHFALNLSSNGSPFLITARSLTKTWAGPQNCRAWVLLPLFQQSCWVSLSYCNLCQYKYRYEVNWQKKFCSSSSYIVDLLSTVHFN